MNALTLGRTKARRWKPVLVNDAGVLANQDLTRDLAKVPFKSYQVAGALVGSGSASSTQTGGIGENTDGSCMCHYMSVAALDATLGTGKVARATFPFYGRMFGIRFSGLIGFAFDVSIDGEAFVVDGRNPHLTNVGVWTGSQMEDAQVVIATDLADIRHVAEVIVWPDKNGGAVRSVRLLGFLGERRVGYHDRVADVGDVVKTGTLTNLQVAFTTGLSQVPRRLHRVLYCNKTASQQVVTVQLGGTTKYELVLAAAGTSGSSQPLDLWGTHPVSLWTHAAGNLTAVEYTIIGTW